MSEEAEQDLKTTSEDMQVRRPTSSIRRLPWVVAITGASGAVYAKRLIETLRLNGETACLVISEPSVSSR